MLNFINDALYAYNASTMKQSNGKDVLQLQVNTSNFIVSYAKGSKLDKYNNPQTNIKLNKKHDIDMRDNPTFVPINREIITVNYLSEKEMNDPKLLSSANTSIKVKTNDRGTPVVSVRCLKADSPNKSDIYVIAYPFNGMIVPIPKDPTYRIYKGLIVSSNRPFYFNNRRYRKILYLIVEPHTALFNPDHKYHKDSIDVKIESFAIYKDRETGDTKTNHETMVLSMMKESSEVKWDYEVLNTEYRIDPETPTVLWETFKFDASKDNKDSGANSWPKNFNKPQENTHRTNKSRNSNTGYVEGNTFITKNKHGIRKEVPINQPSNRRNNKKSEDFESMLKDYMDDYNYDKSNRNNRRNNNKKNRNKRNNYDY